ncbi:hypothetical protein [Streptomyces hypolithicus]
MFEIRVICDPADTDRITIALKGVFHTGAVRRLPARHTDDERLYLTADHHSDTGYSDVWPDPETAYKLAPSIVSEIGWAARTARDVLRKPRGEGIGREYWLRKAAVLDRIALQDEPAGRAYDAADLAHEAARRLMDADSATVICNPRNYTRQQYAQWAKQQ